MRVSRWRYPGLPMSPPRRPSPPEDGDHLDRLGDPADLHLARLGRLAARSGRRRLAPHDLAAAHERGEPRGLTHALARAGPSPHTTYKRPPRCGRCGMLAIPSPYALAPCGASAGRRHICGGGGVIRTREGRFRPLTAFEAVPFVHSGTPPGRV